MALALTLSPSLSFSYLSGWLTHLLVPSSSTCTTYPTFIATFCFTLTPTTHSLHLTLLLLTGRLAEHSLLKAQSQEAKQCRYAHWPHAHNVPMYTYISHTESLIQNYSEMKAVWCYSLQACIIHSNTVEICRAIHSPMCCVTISTRPHCPCVADILNPN